MRLQVNRLPARFWVCSASAAGSHCLRSFSVAPRDREVAETPIAKSAKCTLEPAEHLRNRVPRAAARKRWRRHVTARPATEIRANDTFYPVERFPKPKRRMSLRQ